MYDICEFIFNNVDVNLYDKLSYKIIDLYQYEADICNAIIRDIFKYIEVDDIKFYKDNVNINRKIIVSFKYKGRKCNIYEHFDTQIDYMCLNMEPMV